MLTIRPRRTEDNARLLDVWEKAVRATHTFLAEEDIQFFLPQVRDTYIPALEVWIAQDGSGEILGFMGLSDAKVEMLFIDPACHGQGAGRQLLAHAGALKGRLTVDVNEQNPGAHAFYLKCGFVDVGRSELDTTGRPFPLIHMARGE